MENNIRDGSFGLCVGDPLRVQAEFESREKLMADPEVEMKKCKIFPISFVSKDSLRHGNDYYEGVIKENRIFYRFLDYGDEKTLLPTNYEDFSYSYGDSDQTYEKFVGSFTDPKEEKELHLNDLYWTKHVSISDLFQRRRDGLNSELQLENQNKAVEAFIPYESGLIRFEVDGKFGFADSETGKIKINPIWDYADDFYKGVARVVSGCGVKYYLDYYGIGFETLGGKIAYINTENLQIVPADTDIIKDVHKYNILYEKIMIHMVLKLKDGVECNYCIDSNLENSRKGVIYNNKVYDFNEKTKSLGLVDPQIDDGSFKRSKDDVFLDLDSDQLVRMEVNGQWGCFSLYSGRIVIKPTWDYMDEFIDSKYTRVISDAEITMHLDDKIELSLSGGKHGVIDRCNNIVMQPVYDQLIFFDGWHYMVKKNGKKGLVNRENEVMIPLLYKEMSTISINSEDLFFIVSKDKKKGVINSQNEVVIPLIYDEIKHISFGSYDSSKQKHYFIVSKDKKKGLINLQNEVIIPIQWDEFRTYMEDGTGGMLRSGDTFFDDSFYDSFLEAIGFSFGELIYVVGKDEVIPSFPSGNEKRFDAYLKNEDVISPVSTRKYGIYGRDFNLIVPVELDRRPVFCRNLRAQDRDALPFNNESEVPYMILTKNGRFGFLSSTGEIISEIILSKKDAVKVLKEKWRRESVKYLRSVLKEMEEFYSDYPEAWNYEKINDYWVKYYTPQLIEVFKESKEPKLKILASEMETELKKLNIKKIKALFVQMHQILEAR